MPRTFGLVHRRKHDEINCRSFYIPDDYIEPLGKGLSFCMNLRKLDLSRTQLSCKNGIKIVHGVPTQLQELVLSHN